MARPLGRVAAVATRGLGTVYEAFLTRQQGANLVQAFSS
jgi:hypothetical protein